MVNRLKYMIYILTLILVYFCTIDIDIVAIKKITSMKPIKNAEMQEV